MLMCEINPEIPATQSPKLGLRASVTASLKKIWSNQRKTLDTLQTPQLGVAQTRPCWYTDSCLHPLSRAEPVPNPAGSCKPVSHIEAMLARTCTRQSLMPPCWTYRQWWWMRCFSTQCTRPSPPPRCFPCAGRAPSRS